MHKQRIKKGSKPIRTKVHNIGLIIAIGMGFLAGCVPGFGGAGIPPTLSAPIVPKATRMPIATETPVPTFTQTPTATETPIPTITPTLTDTPTLTEIPEWANTEPNKPETWPQWAQVYFQDPEASAKNTPELHQKFYEFLNESRRNFITNLPDADLRLTLERVVNPWSPGQYLTGLTQANLESMTPEAMRKLIPTMSPDELRWAMMGYNLNLAPEKRTEIVLSPQDMVDIISDPKALVVFYENDSSARDPNTQLFPWMWGKFADGQPQIHHLYGRWQDDPNPLDWLIPFEQGFVQTIDIFGIPATFSGYPSVNYYGDIWAAFRIPGIQQMSVIGIRQISSSGEQSLIFVGASAQPITEDHAVIVAAAAGQHLHLIQDAGKITNKATEYLQIEQIRQTANGKDIFLPKEPYDEKILLSHLGDGLFAKMYALPLLQITDNDGIQKAMATVGVYHRGMLALSYLSIGQF